MYKRATSGAETLITRATSSELTTGLKEYNTTSFNSEFALDPTDRIVVKYYFWSNSNSNKTVSFYYDGNTYYTHVVTPIDITNLDYTRRAVNETITGNWTFNGNTTIASTTIANSLLTNATATNLFINQFANLWEYDLDMQQAKFATSSVSATSTIDGGQDAWSLRIGTSTTPTLEYATWQRQISRKFNPALPIYCDITYDMDATTTGSLGFNASIARITTSSKINVPTWNDNLATSTVPGTAGNLGYLTITLSNTGSLTAGDVFRFKISRQNALVNDFLNIRTIKLYQ